MSCITAYELDASGPGDAPIKKSKGRLARSMLVEECIIVLGPALKKEKRS
jgi:hypothetical protein